MGDSRSAATPPNAPKITTFLTFSGALYGKAEEAIRFYVSVFPDSKVDYLQRHGKGESVPEGELRRAAFTLAGVRYMATESKSDGDPGFTPAFSLYVECTDPKETARLFERLAEGGKVHMPLRAYPSSELFAWFDDKYGISWQLEIPRASLPR